MMMFEGTKDEFYEISVVSRLTGLSAYLLRAWEKRYQVVEPYRADNKRRLYTKEDIDRLTLLKALTDNGYKIGEIAALGLDALEARLAEMEGLDDRQSGAGTSSTDPVPCRIGIVGVQVRNTVREAADWIEELTVASEFNSLPELVENTKKSVLDLLIVEVSSLFAENVTEVREAIEKLSIKRAIVVYHFASEEVVSATNIEKITALRAPITASEIVLALSADIKIRKINPPDTQAELEPASDGIPERLFTDQQLALIGRRSATVKCECPQHLSHLLESLNAFEDYSQECENRNEEDAQLHGFLHSETSQCRHRLELALIKVIETEGIEI